MTAQRRGYIPESHLKRPLSPHIVGGWYNNNPWSRVMYVDSSHRLAGDTGRDGLDYSHPLATLAQAITQIDTKGWTDTLVLLGPGHLETFATDITINEARTTIVGLGHGQNRSRLTATATGATVDITGAGCAIHNVFFFAGIDSVVALVTLTGASPLLDGCFFLHNSTNQALVSVSAVATADYGAIRNCMFRNVAAGATSAIELVGPDSFTVQGCDIIGDYSEACISNKTTAAPRMCIDRNWLENLNAVDVCINLVGTSTGHCSHNMCRVATDAQTTWIDVADGQLFENYGVNNDGETGILIGTPSV
jgi:hypothetical protein